MKTGTANNVIEAFPIVVVDVFFRIMHVDPAPNLHCQLLGVLLSFFEVCVVPLLPILESGSLRTRDTFESGHVLSKALYDSFSTKKTYRNFVCILVANATLFLPASFRQAAIEIPSSMAWVAPFAEVGRNECALSPI